MALPALPHSLLGVQAPQVKWIASGNYTADGKPMFYSRPWGPGERETYMKQFSGHVVGRHVVLLNK